MVKHKGKKKRAKIYMALLGLESFRRRAKKDKATFREYLGILIPKLKSDITKLEELMMFFTTGKRMYFIIFFA